MIRAHATVRAMILSARAAEISVAMIHALNDMRLKKWTPRTPEYNAYYRARYFRKRAYWQARKEDPKKAEKNRRLYIKRNPKQHLAHCCVSSAIQSGRLKRPKFCEQCHAPEKKGRRGQSLLYAHHFKGYAKKNWLIVKFICRDCDSLNMRKYANS